MNGGKTENKNNGEKIIPDTGKISFSLYTPTRILMIFSLPLQSRVNRREYNRLCTYLPLVETSSPCYLILMYKV